MNIEKNRRTASVALSTILVLLLLLGTLLTMFSLTVVAAAADEGGGEQQEEDPTSKFTSFTINGQTSLTVSPNELLTWSASAICASPASGAQSCSNAGTEVNGPVPDGYIIQIQQATGSCSQQGLVFTDTVDSKTTSGGSASGTFNAPTTPGTYCYRAFHPEQTIGGFTWADRPSNADGKTVEITVQAAEPQTLTLSCSGPDAQDPCSDTGDIGPGDTGHYVLSYTITANEDLTNVKVQGGITVKAKNIVIKCDGTPVWTGSGWPSSTDTVGCAGGQLTINTSKKNNVLTLTFSSMGAGESHTLTIEFDWTPTSAGTQSIAGEWSAVCTSSQGTTKTPYTPRVSVDV